MRNRTGNFNNARVPRRSGVGGPFVVPRLEELVASVPEPKKLVVIEGADHFFEGRLHEMRQAIEGWVKQTI